MSSTPWPILHIPFGEWHAVSTSTWHPSPRAGAQANRGEVQHLSHPKWHQPIKLLLCNRSPWWWQRGKSSQRASWWRESSVLECTEFQLLRARGAQGWLGWAGPLGSEHLGEESVITRLGSWPQGASRAPPTLEPKSGLLMKRIECFGMYGISVPQIVLRGLGTWQGSSWSSYLVLYKIKRCTYVFLIFWYCKLENAHFTVVLLKFWPCVLEKHTFYCGFLDILILHAWKHTFYCGFLDILTLRAWKTYILLLFPWYFDTARLKTYILLMFSLHFDRTCLKNTHFIVVFLIFLKDVHESMVFISPRE